MPHDNLKARAGTLLILGVFGGFTMFHLVRLLQVVRR